MNSETIEITLPEADPVVERINYLEAPLVHLVETDPKNLSPDELRQYITSLRTMRGSAATAKAATRRSGQVKAKQGYDVGGLL